MFLADTLKHSEPPQVVGVLHCKICSVCFVVWFWVLGFCLHVVVLDYQATEFPGLLDGIEIKNSPQLLAGYKDGNLHDRTSRAFVCFFNPRVFVFYRRVFCCSDRSDMHVPTSFYQNMRHYHAACACLLCLFFTDLLFFFCQRVRVRSTCR